MDHRIAPGTGAVQERLPHVPAKYSSPRRWHETVPLPTLCVLAKKKMSKRPPFVAFTLVPRLVRLRSSSSRSTASLVSLSPYCINLDEVSFCYGGSGPLRRSRHQRLRNLPLHLRHRAGGPYFVGLVPRNQSPSLEVRAHLARKAINRVCSVQRLLFVSSGRNGLNKGNLVYHLQLWWYNIFRSLFENGCVFF